MKQNALTDYHIPLVTKTSFEIFFHIVYFSEDTTRLPNVEAFQSTITEKIAVVHYFPGNTLRFKIFKEANRCLLKDRLRQEVDLFILIKYFSSLGDLVSSLFSNFQLKLANASWENVHAVIFSVLGIKFLARPPRVAIQNGVASNKQG